MVKIIIEKWDQNKSWTNWSGQAKSQFISRMKELCKLRNTEIKRLARDVLDKNTHEFLLDGITKKEDAGSIRHLLESLGAVVKVEEVSLNNP